MDTHSCHNYNALKLREGTFGATRLKMGVGIGVCGLYLLVDAGKVGMHVCFLPSYLFRSGRWEDIMHSFE